MNTKGLVMKQVFIALLMVVVCALILFWFAERSAKAAVALKEDIECYESVKMAAASKAFGKNTMELKCPTKNVTIKSDMIGDIDDLKHRYAGEMYNCWRKMNRGSSNPFSYWFTREDKTICIVCSIITADEGIISRFSSIDNFGIFLLEKPVPGKEYSYYEEFTGIAASAELKNAPKVKRIKISPGTTYAALFIISEEREKEKWTKSVAEGGLVGAGATAATIGPGLLVLSMPVEGALAAFGVGFGIGAYFGDLESDYSDRWSAGALLVPYQYATTNMHCAELGTAPFENPFIKARR